MGILVRTQLRYLPSQDLVHQNGLRLVLPLVRPVANGATGIRASALDAIRPTARVPARLLWARTISMSPRSPPGEFGWSGHNLRRGFWVSLGVRVCRLRDLRARRRRRSVSSRRGRLCGEERFRRGLDVDPKQGGPLTVPYGLQRLQLAQGLKELPGEMGFVPDNLVDVEEIWQQAVADRRRLDICSSGAVFFLHLASAKATADENILRITERSGMSLSQAQRAQLTPSARTSRAHSMEPRCAEFRRSSRRSRRGDL
jgi:hypothetical protein